MTRTTITQSHEDRSIEMVLDHTVLIRQAQGEVGQDMAKAVKSGMQWAGDKVSKIWHSLVGATQPPTAVCDAYMRSSPTS